jgi:hypothetical protein
MYVTWFANVNDFLTRMAASNCTPNSFALHSYFYNSNILFLILRLPAMSNFSTLLLRHPPLPTDGITHTYQFPHTVLPYSLFMYILYLLTDTNYWPANLFLFCRSTCEPYLSLFGTRRYITLILPHFLPIA